MNNRLMRAIDSRDGSAMAAISGGAQHTDKVVNFEAERLVDSLFRQLKKVFPAAAQTVLKTDEDEKSTKQQWIAAFAENGIRTREQLSAGMQLARASESPFWPSSGQFIAWCRQGAMKAAGLPEEQALIDEVKRYSRNQDLYPTIEDYPWPTNAIYWMGKSLYFDMRENHWTDAQLRSAAKKELSNMIRRIEAGEVIPAPVTTIQSPRKSHRPLSGDKGLEKIREIRAKLGLRGGNANRDD